MRAAFVRVDVVHEGERVFAVLIVVLERTLDFDVLARRFERDRLGMERTAVADDPLHEFGQAALIEERLFLGAALALVFEDDRERLVQEGKLAQPVGDGRVVEARLGENLGVGLNHTVVPVPFALPTTSSFFLVSPRSNAM